MFRSRARHRSSLPRFRWAHAGRARRQAGDRPGQSRGEPPASTTRPSCWRRCGEDLRAEAPDHLALTGDLSNLSLDGEWRAALRWLEQQGAAPATATVIPGNHDAYVAEVVRAGTFEKLFGPFQTGDVDGVASGAGENGAGGGDGRERYPFVRLRGPLALIGVNSCVATGNLGAWGQVGSEQLARLEALLGHAEVARRIRVVLIHHPPVMHKGGEARNLKDRDALAAVLARAGADIVLHGHDHRDERADPGRAGRPPYPNHRRWLGVVRGRPRAARSLQHLRARRERPHHAGHARPRRGNQSLQGSAPRGSPVPSPVCGTGLGPQPSPRRRGGEGVLTIHPYPQRNRADKKHVWLAPQNPP